MTTVTLDGVLAEFVPKRHLTSSAATVGDLLDEFEGKYPALRFRMRDETGAVRRFIRVFVNGTDIATGAGLATRLSAHDSVDVLHSIQGG